MNVTILTDASFCPKYNVAGYGVWVASERGRWGGGGLLKGRVKSSLNAEAMAIVNGLYIAKAVGLVHAGDVVLVQTDCQAAIDMLPRGSQNDGEFNRIHRSFLKHAKDIKVVFRHVKGHSGKKDQRSLANNHCDRTAKEYMRAERDRLIELKEARNGSVLARNDP